MTIARGLRAFAAPTARLAPGRPMRRARAVYDSVVPYGISPSARHTARWKGVPSGAMGSSKVRRRPAKYSASWRRASAKARRAGCQSGRGDRARAPRAKPIHAMARARPARSSGPIGVSRRAYWIGVASGGTSPRSLRPRPGIRAARLRASPGPGADGGTGCRPRPRLLERGGGLQHGEVREAAADDLETDGQAGWGEAGGHGRGRLAGEVERVAERRPP